MYLNQVVIHKNWLIMIDVEKMHFEPRENNISVLGQTKLDTDNLELDVRGSLSGSLACKGVQG